MLRAVIFSVHIGRIYMCDMIPIVKYHSSPLLYIYGCQNTQWCVVSIFAAAKCTIVDYYPTPPRHLGKRPFMPNKKLWTLCLIKNYELCAGDHPPLVLCAGDEGTPSPHHLAKEQPFPRMPLPGEKCLYQEKHFTVTLTSRTPPQTTLKHNSKCYILCPYKWTHSSAISCI